MDTPSSGKNSLAEKGKGKDPAKKQDKFPIPWLKYFVIGSLIALLLYLGKSSLEEKTTALSYVQFELYVKQGEIDTVNIEEDHISGKCAPTAACKNTYSTTIPEPFLRDSKPLEDLKNEFLKAKGEGAASRFRYISRNNFFYNILIPMLPWIFIFAFGWWWLSRQFRVQGGTGGILGFNKSRARRIQKGTSQTTFQDVAGIDEAKEEVIEVVEFLKAPEKFKRLGARIPRGILLVGAPGIGKTLMAKAIAGEADVPFFSISGSDFVELFVGVGAARVRDLFYQAKENSPSIVFLDEIDAVGRRRGAGLGGGHDEREQTLNQILVEMDGFDTDDNVIVMAATNRPDVLDPALLRPGRFDREIMIDLPDVKGRLEILQVHAKKVKLDPSVKLEVIARTTPTFSGADLAAIINEAALLAVIKKRDTILQEDFEEARDKVRWGRQKKSRVMEEEDKKITAYHESGHTLVAKSLPGMDPIHKVTIIPRGMALGATMPLPEKDRYHMQKQYALHQLTVLLGGRSAEEIFFNDISAGAQDDIKKASELARLMVCEWGMSDVIGPINYSEDEEHLFLGREIARTRNHSEATAVKIDEEVATLLKQCHNQARQILLERKEVCERLAQALLQKEVLGSDEIDKIIQGHGDQYPSNANPILGSPPPTL